MICLHETKMESITVGVVSSLWKIKVADWRELLECSRMGGIIILCKEGWLDCEDTLASVCIEKLEQFGD